MRKILMKEIEFLKDKLDNVKSLTDQKYEENLRKTAEYEELKLEEIKQTRQIGKVLNSQQIKLDYLESLIENLELKTKDLKKELTSMQAAQKDDSFEFEELKAQFDKFKASYKKKMDFLKFEVQTAQEGVKRETEYELELEKIHQEKLKKTAEEFAEKLKAEKEKVREKMKNDEEMYKIKAEPLLFRSQVLDSEIKTLESKIADKTKELEGLQNTYERLLKKFNKALVKQNIFLYESKLIMKSIKEALKYLKEQPESVTDDVILGVFMAKANLQWIIERLGFSFSGSLWTYHKLRQLLKHCQDIIRLHETKSPLLKENLWKDGPEDLKYGVLSLTDDEFLLAKFDSCQSIDNYMMKGTPEDSDFCINELIVSKCKVSDYCWLSEINGDFHSGYKTTHRLLYLQTALKVKCDKLSSNKFSVASVIKTKLCQQMLLEAVALFKSSIFSLTQDLFMEQIALCGLEGHEEFAVRTWRNEVRSWQNENGCFGKKMNFTNCSTYKSFERMKKTDTVIDGCHSHTTAVAISALAFFLRIVLKTAFNLA